LRGDLAVSIDARNLQLAFPKQVGRGAAKDEVAAELDRIDPGWRRLFVLYPRDDAIRGEPRRTP
jgi:hypothetical protein